ncbi:MAG: hypothetical protein KDI09_18925 [Halioglobus sp.]|nr:hypothetical protein [Halioglobus sp.]
MNDQQYLGHCIAQLTDFASRLSAQAAHLPHDDPLRELAEAFTTLAVSGKNLYATGPSLIGRLFTTYPELAPMLPRELLWFFGGDCLHFMPDEEIAQHQRLEELRLEAAASGEVIDLKKARAGLLDSR